MRRVSGAVVLVLLAACFDTALPPPPGPGSITGRVLVAAPGEPIGSPVSGATITLVESGLSVKSNDDGRFTIAPLVQTEGTLEISSGALKRVFSLQSLGVGVGRAVAMGDVALSRNASVQGEVLLENSNEAGGTLVFLEGQPNSAYTNQSGAFLLRELPVGAVTLSVFRAGYAPQKVPLELRSGERTVVDSIVLKPEPLSASSVNGRALLEGRDDATGIKVSVGALETNVDASGSYSFPALSPGVHTFVFRAEGRRTVTLANRLIAAAVVELPNVTLTTGEMNGPVVEPFPQYDAGAAGGGVGTTGGGTAVGGGSATGGGSGGIDAGNALVVTRVSAGSAHTCAIADDRRAVCWGRDTFGQITGPAGADVVAPTLVASDVIDISAGGTHTCVVHTDAGIECWGSNADLQLGVTTPTAGQRGFPPFTARSISTGLVFTCAVSGAELYCWGSNREYQCGNGSTQNTALPQTMDNVTLAEAAALGDQHSCVVMLVSGSPSVKCVGKLLLPSSVQPGAVLISEVRQLASGSQHSCAVKLDGTVYCWGAQATSGQLGTDAGTTPKQVPGITNGTAIAAGGQHSCALLADGTLSCWGGNTQGQLGDGSFDGGINRVTSNITDVVSVTAGGTHTCAIRDGGSVWCWGNNVYGQLGADAGVNSNVPVRVLLSR